MYWILLAFAFEYLILPPYQDILNRLSPVFKGLFAGMTASIMLADFLTVSIRSFLSMTPEEKTLTETQFINTARPLLEDPMVKKLSQCKHHRDKTRLDHVKEVAYLSFLWGERFPWTVRRLSGAHYCTIFSIMTGCMKVQGCTPSGTIILP